jgi:hypothetical protein
MLVCSVISTQTLIAGFAVPSQQLLHTLHLPTSCEVVCNLSEIFILNPLAFHIKMYKKNSIPLLTLALLNLNLCNCIQLGCPNKNILFALLSSSSANESTVFFVSRLHGEGETRNPM